MCRVEESEQESFFFKQKTAYELLSGLVGSEMCIRNGNHVGLDYLEGIVFANRDLLQSRCVEYDICSFDCLYHGGIITYITDTEFQGLLGVFIDNFVRG